MKIMLKSLVLAAGLVGAAAPALAQEVLVIGQRRGGEAGYYGGIVVTSSRPAM